MADIKVRIEVNPNAESEVLGDVNNVNAEISNVSVKTNASNVFQNIPTSESSGINGLSFAQDLIFDEQGYVDNEDMQGGVVESEQNPTEFVWGVVPENKQYSVKLTFTNAQNLKDIVVYGDKTVNQFPTRAIIDGTTEIFSDDYRWAINLQTESDTHTIEFTHWNRANYNACLTLIRILMRYFEVDNRNGLKSVESLSQSTGQPKEILYGVVPSSGSLKVVDIDGEISDMVRDGIIPISNSHIEIISNGKQTQSHISVDSDYDNNAKVLSVEFTNDLTKWNDLQYKGFAYPKKSENAYNILLDVFSYVGFTQDQVDEMLSTEIVYGVDNRTGTIKQYLQEITIPYPYLPQASVRETIDKFCTLAQLQVFKTDDDNIKFISARPVATNEEKGKVIFIDKGSIFGNFTKNILLKNKYDAIEISENKVTDSIDYDTQVYSFMNYDFSNINENDNNNASGVYKTYGAVNHNIDTGNYEYTGRGTFTYIENKYISGNYTLSANSFNGLEIISNIYNNINNGLKFSVTYRKKQKNITNFNKQIDLGSNTGSFSYDFSNVSFEGIVGTIETKQIPTEIKNTHNYSDVSTEVSLKNLSSANIEYDEISNRFNIEYNLLSFANIYETTGESSYANRTYEKTVSMPEYGTITQYEPLEINISLYGDKRVISFEDIFVSDDISNKKTIVSIQGSELLQSNTTFNDIKMSDIIKTNIKSDYANGISNATMTVACVDYYDENRKKIKDWANGEIFEVGDIVKVEGDNSLWRVTGRNFKKSGVPLIDLELQEIKILG